MDDANIASVLLELHKLVAMNLPLQPIYLDPRKELSGLENPSWCLTCVDISDDAVIKLLFKLFQLFQLFTLAANMREISPFARFAQLAIPHFTAGKHGHSRAFSHSTNLGTPAVTVNKVGGQQGCETRFLRENHV